MKITQRVSVNMRNKLAGALTATCMVWGLTTVGCSCEKEEKKPAPAPVAEPKKPEIPADVDKELLELLKSASTTCTVAEARKRITCNGGEKNALVLSFNKGERNRVEALPTFAFALGKEDEKLQALAASVLYASFRTGLGPKVEDGAVKAELAQQLLDTALKLPDPVAMQVIPAATHASHLSGRGKELVAALTDDVSIQIRTMAYRYMMVYGRLGAFETVRELGTNPGAAVVLAAIESPRNMKDWTSADQEAICPWAAGFLEDERPPVAGNAMAVLSNCTGEELDQLLERMDKTLKDKQFSFIHSTALRDVCGPALKRREKGATEAQCKKVRQLQEKAAKNSDVKGRVRAMSLSSLAYTWADDKSLKLAKQLSKDKDADVQRTATQVTTRLEQKLQASQ